MRQDKILIYWTVVFFFFCMPYVSVHTYSMYLVLVVMNETLIGLEVKAANLLIALSELAWDTVTLLFTCFLSHWYVCMA